MRYYIFIIWLMLAAVFTCSCDQVPPINEKRYIKRFEEFIQQVEEKGNEYNQTQWEEKDKKFKKYSEIYFERFKDDLSRDQKDKINQLRGKYVGLKARYTTEQQFKAFKKKLQKTIDQMKGAIEGFLPDSLEE